MLGTLGRTRFQGATDVPVFEQVVITFWYDFLDSREIALVATPIIVCAYLVIKAEQRLVRIITWFLTNIVVNQFLLPGGWSAVLARKSHGFVILLFTGLACGLTYPFFEKFLWRALNWLHETKVLTEEK